MVKIIEEAKRRETRDFSGDSRNFAGAFLKHKNELTPMCNDPKVSVEELRRKALEIIEEEEVRTDSGADKSILNKIQTIKNKNSLVTIIWELIMGSKGLSKYNY